MIYDRRNILLCVERKKLKLQLCQAINCVPDLTSWDHSDFVCILLWLLLVLKSLSSSEALYILFGSLFFFILPGIFSEWVLWIDQKCHMISRFTSLTDLKHWDPCTGSILPSVDIAENLRVVYKAKKCRQLAMPSFNINIFDFVIKWNNLLWNSLWLACHPSIHPYDGTRLSGWKVSLFVGR